MPSSLKNIFSGFSADVFSEAKNPLNPDQNEDCFIVEDELLAVIDGASEKAKTRFNYKGKTGGKFLADLTRDILIDLVSVCSSGLFPMQGKDLVDLLSETCQKEFDRLDIDRRLLKKNPEFRPSASFVSAFVFDNEVVVTQLGDVAFRINGQDIYACPKPVDQFNSAKRCRAIQEAKQKYPGISMEGLMILGRKAIELDFLTQVSQYQNNPSHSLGHGIFNGIDVPGKFIKTFRFKRNSLQTLEIFSDGYFGAAEKPAIDSWEEFFAFVEREDPYKNGKFPSTKGSDPKKGIFSDDRTVIVSRFG